MSFTDQKPWVVSEEDCKRPWSGGKNGSRFRCGICGHKFVSGDIARWMCTNHIRGYSGNPFVCEDCDSGTEKNTLEKWMRLVDEWNADKNGRYWKFVAHLNDCVPREC